MSAKTIGFGVVTLAVLGAFLLAFQIKDEHFTADLQSLSPENKMKMVELPEGTQDIQIVDHDLKEYLINCIRSSKPSHMGRRTTEIYNLYVVSKKQTYKFWVRYDVGNRKLNFWSSIVLKDGSSKSGENQVSDCTIEGFNQKLTTSS